MESKKTKKMEAEEKGLGAVVMENISSTLNMVSKGISASIHEATHDFTNAIIKRIVLFISVFIGVFFLINGLAQMMSAVYQRPGFGEMVMGVFVLLIALVMYAFRKN